MKNKKAVLKLILDVAMLLTLALLYKKSTLGIAFHEIAGLALFGAFLIHHIINIKWSAAVTKRIFKKGMPGLVRANWIVDVLLAAAFLAIAVSGVLMSKVVFHISAHGSFKTLHYFASALALILMGVHLGLHAAFLLKPAGGLLAKKAGKIIGAVALAAAFAFGCVSMFSTSFLRYLCMPFASSAAVKEGAGEGIGGGEGALGAQPGRGEGKGMNAGQGGGKGMNAGQGGHGGEEAGGLSQAALLLVQDLCIMSVFASITGLTCFLIKNKKRRSGPCVSGGDDEAPKQAA